MSKWTTSAICSVMIGCGGLAIFAASGFGDDPGPAPTPLSHFRVVSPAMQTAAAPAASSARKPPKSGGGKGGKSRQPKDPKVINLITTNPVAVPAGQEVVAKLTCPAARGIPLSGGAIAPPDPASVAISVISRFNPNPPYDAEPHNYYVGVRNTGTAAEDFRGTLVCAKGVDESGG